MNLSASEQLMYSTIKIECIYKNGLSGSGTGFFFSFDMKSQKGERVPVIVTNKHVVTDSVIGKLVFTKMDAEGNPLDRDHKIMQFTDFQKRWIMHPYVDLCIMPILPIIIEANSQGDSLFTTFLDESLLVPANKLDSLKAIEDVIMVGYPTGLLDSVNNKPIFRKGITATHYKYDYNNKKEFLIDAACFPGSSGSPVFICNEGTFSEKDPNKAYMGTRLYFLGVLYAGPQYTAEGIVKVVDVPTVQAVKSISAIPNNLGYVIKSSCILDFLPILKKLTGVN